MPNSLFRVFDSLTPDSPYAISLITNLSPSNIYTPPTKNPLHSPLDDPDVSSVIVI